MPDVTGKDIGRYRILAPLGEGGMASVYRAHDSHLDTEVAVKFIRPEAFPPDILPQIMQRFEREARVLARLNHAAIVDVLDYGAFEGVPFLVMRYIPGGTVKDRLGAPVPYREAAALLLPVARALAYAHQRGILHRDVKPTNILITDTGEPVLTDFGIARMMDAGDGQALTGTGVGLGTPEYMAPEQGLGNPVDGRADVYALGVVLYELVTGRRPYEAPTPMGVMLKHVTEPLPRPRDYIDGLPLQVERIITRALAKNPDERPTMAEFADQLNKVAEGEIPNWEEADLDRPDGPEPAAKDRPAPAEPLFASGPAFLNTLLPTAGGSETQSSVKPTSPVSHPVIDPDPPAPARGFALPRLTAVQWTIIAAVVLALVILLALTLR